MVRRQRLTTAIAAIVLAIGCQEQHRAPKAEGEPQVRATVVTIRSTLQPSNKTFVHALMIANNVARSGDEVDNWRLIDLRNQQVTFVDDVTKTFRTQPIAELVKQHRQAYAAQPAPELPVAQWLTPGATRTVSGYDATQAIVRMGAYQRELWIAEKTPIPAELFSFLRASEPAPSPIAGVARAVDDALLKVRGFPLSDHAELPFGEKKLVVDHVVMSIQQKDVPASWFVVPASYKRTGV